jgi:ribosomal protein S27AE
MEPYTKKKEECPFCHEQVLGVLWWPSHKSAYTSRSAVAKSTTWLLKPEGHELLSEKCTNCGKSAKEIEKAWREGPEQKVDQRKRLEELKKLGFSGTVRS